MNPVINRDAVRFASLFSSIYLSNVLQNEEYEVCNDSLLES